MTHHEKVERFQELLRQRRFWVSNAIPPVWRLFWALGIKTPPPYFLPFFPTCIIVGLLFGSLWGLFMRLTV